MRTPSACEEGPGWGAAAVGGGVQIVQGLNQRPAGAGGHAGRGRGSGPGTSRGGGEAVEQPWRMTGRQKAAGAGPPWPVAVGSQFRAPGESGL